MKVTLKGEPHEATGQLPEEGNKAPSFELEKLDGGKVTLQDFQGEVVILSVFPDISTSTCQRQTSTFNEKAKDLDDIKILSVSINEKEEQQKWIDGKEINMALVRDTSRQFGKAYGVYLEDIDKLARSIFVINREGQLIYKEIVSEMAEEPDYKEAISVARHATAEL